MSKTIRMTKDNSAAMHRATARIVGAGLKQLSAIYLRDDIDQIGRAHKQFIHSLRGYSRVMHKLARGAK